MVNAINSKRVKDKPYPVKVTPGLIRRITKEGIIYSRKEILKRIKGKVSHRADVGHILWILSSK